MGENIFSLAFCANIADRDINKYFDVMAGTIRDEPLTEEEMISPTAEDAGLKTFFKLDTYTD